MKKLQNQTQKTNMIFRDVLQIISRKFVHFKQKLLKY